MEMVYSSWINKQRNICHKTPWPEHRNIKAQLLLGSGGDICQRLMLEMIGQDSQRICAVLLFVVICCCLVAVYNHRGWLVWVCIQKMSRLWSQLRLSPCLSHSPKPKGLSRYRAMQSQPSSCVCFLMSQFHSGKLPRRHRAGC